MELLLIGLAGVVAYLWHRVDKLERNQHWLAENLEAGLRAAHSQSATSEPASPGQRQQVSEYAPSPDPVRTAPADRQPEEADREAPAADADRRPDPESGPLDRFAGILAWRPSFDFEDIFGRRLPIWGGGVALAIAGFFLVRWSIENGLLNESVRVSLGFVFGLVLLAGAELSYRFDERLADPRVRQALAGAGLATLYTSFYLAGSHYGLIDGGIAFAGLAGVTALAIALSYRFGLPSAVLGLLGGFAAPALAGATEPNLPILATYLAMVTGGLVHTGRRQGRGWLGLAALAGGLGWGALMLTAAPGDAAGVLAIGGYLVLVGTMLPSLMGQGSLGKIGRLAACALATIQIAALVDISGYSMLAWGTYGLLAGAIAILGWRNRQMREAGGMAAALSAFLIAAWPDPAGSALTLIAGMMAVIFLGAPLLRAAIDEPAEIDWGQLAVYPLALVAALCIQLSVRLPDGENLPVAFAALALALAPAVAVWFHWSRSCEPLATWPMASFASALVAVGLAGLLATPGWAAPLITAAVGTSGFAMRRYQREVEGHLVLWGVAVAGLLLQVMTADDAEFFRLIDGAGAWGLSLDTLRAAATALPFALLAWWNHSRRSARAAQLLAVAFAYGALAQSVPADWLPALLAAAALALAWRMRWRAAHAGALAISALWALPALASWGAAGVEALAGNPMMDLAAADRAFLLRTVLPFGAAWAGSLALSPRFFAQRRLAGWSIAAALAMVLIHALYKAVFNIHDVETFVASGMAERTFWQAAIVLPALACLFVRERFAGQRAVGLGLAAAGLAHFGLFTLVLHNPLWDAQEVGPAPLANLLLPAYAIAVAMLAALREAPGRYAAKLRPVADAAIMSLVTIFSLSELRQAFSGTVLNAASMTQQEDLLRSLLAIGLALAFLAWGAWRRQRSWRIGSLVLMLLAVSKVFLFDAAGLEGLARIASFLALGLCLIGIGWFYTRQLKAAKNVA